MSKIDFLKQFLSKPSDVGAIAPSSRELAEMVCEAAGVCEANTVVEFGAGTGAITEVILERLKLGAAFFAMEINPKFVNIVRAKLPQARVIEDCATETPKYLKELGRNECDCIVSGLPWTVFGPSLQNALLDATIESLRPGGRFATYTYLQSRFLPASKHFNKKIRDRFSVVGTTPIVWRNLPPAVVVYGIK